MPQTLKSGNPLISMLSELNVEFMVEKNAKLALICSMRFKKTQLKPRLKAYWCI